MTKIIQALNAFIPMDRRQALAQQTTLPKRTTGAALMADISGITPLTQALVQELGRQQGAESLLLHINPIFEQLIGELHRYGGSVIGFAGDSITCWLDDNLGSSASRAVACGLAMQEAMQTFSLVTTPNGNKISLRIKVAIAQGLIRRFLVGDSEIRQIETLAGATLQRMAAAENMANAGEVVVTEDVANSLTKNLLITAWREDDNGRFAIIHALTTPVAPTPWPPLPADSLTPEQMRPWILADVYARLQQGRRDVGDLRPITPLMLRFTGLDFDTDDEVGTKLDTYIRWVQTIIHQYGGTLLQLTIGDKGSYLYAPFGVPIAHEDDPRRALLAAIALQAPPPELAFIEPVQIGLSRGDAWTGTCGASTRYTFGVMGSPVNLAARLMMQAEPGQTLVAGDMYQPTAFQYQPLGDLLYKGFDALTPTYQLLAPNHDAADLFTETMVGRQEELEQLLSFAKPLENGRFAGVAIIYGEAGIGKSRLAYALKETLAEQVSWLTGQSDNIFRHGFNAFVYWLRPYFQQSPTATEAENKRQFEAQFEQLLQQLPDSALALQAELQRIKSILGALLGLHWPDSLYEQLDADGRYQNSLFAIKTLLQAESLLKPVVLEVEDAHWLDEASLELLSVLTRNIQAYPILILLTSRYDDTGQHLSYNLAPETATLTLDLNALSVASLRQLAENSLAGPISDDLLALLAARTELNPFFTHQILYYFQEHHALITDKNGRWHLSQLSSELPTNISAVLIARIDRLAAHVRDVVQMAAVLGREFEIRLLAHMLQANVLPTIQQAEQAQVWSIIQELRCIFKHVLLRDAAYAMQLQTRRRKLHHLVTSAYQQIYAADLAPYYEELAYHYGQANDQQQERIYAQLAGTQAADQYNHPQAIRWFTRTLELTANEHHQERFDLLLTIEKSHAHLGHRDEQRQLFATMTPLAETLGAEAMCSLALRRAEMALVTNEYETTAAACQEAATLADEADDIAQKGIAERLWGESLFRRGQYEAADNHYKNALAYAKKSGDLAQEGAVLWNLGHIETAFRQNYAQCRAYYQQSIAAHEASGNRKGVGLVTDGLGIMANRFSDEDPGIYHQQALQIFREIGYRYGECNVLNNLGLVIRNRGDYDGARHTFLQALDMARETGNRQREGWIMTNLGGLARRTGDYESAAAYYRDGFQLFEQIGDRPFTGAAIYNLGLVQEAQAHYADAKKKFADALAIFRKINHRVFEGYALFGLGMVLTGLNQLDEAQTISEECVALRRTVNQPQMLMEALAALARLFMRLGEPAKAKVSVTEIVTFLNEGGALNNAEAPLRIYLTCYDVLKANHKEQAVGILQLAYDALQAQAANLSNPDTKQNYLTEIPWHREIVSAWKNAATE